MNQYVYPRRQPRPVGLPPYLPLTSPVILSTTSLRDSTPRQQVILLQSSGFFEKKSQVADLLEEQIRAGNGDVLGLNNEQAQTGSEEGFRIYHERFQQHASKQEQSSTHTHELRPQKELRSGMVNTIVPFSSVPLEESSKKFHDSIAESGEPTRPKAKERGTQAPPLFIVGKFGEAVGTSNTSFNSHNTFSKRRSTFSFPTSESPAIAPGTDHISDSAIVRAKDLIDTSSNIGSSGHLLTFPTANVVDEMTTTSNLSAAAELSSNNGLFLRNASRVIKPINDPLTPVPVASSAAALVVVPVPEAVEQMTAATVAALPTPPGRAAAGSPSLFSRSPYEGHLDYSEPSRPYPQLTQHEVNAHHRPRLPQKPLAYETLSDTASAASTPRRLLVGTAYDIYFSNQLAAQTNRSSSSAPQHERATSHLEPLSFTEAAQIANTTYQHHSLNTREDQGPAPPSPTTATAQHGLTQLSVRSSDTASSTMSRAAASVTSTPFNVNVSLPSTQTQPSTTTPPLPFVLKPCKIHTTPNSLSATTSPYLSSALTIHPVDAVAAARARNKAKKEELRRLQEIANGDAQSNPPPRQKRKRLDSVKRDDNIVGNSPRLTKRPPGRPRKDTSGMTVEELKKLEKSRLKGVAKRNRANQIHGTSDSAAPDDSTNQSNLAPPRKRNSLNPRASDNSATSSPPFANRPGFDHPRKDAGESSAEELARLEAIQAVQGRFTEQQMMIAQASLNLYGDARALNNLKASNGTIEAEQGPKETST